jgi:hypothetical protein
MLKWNKTLIGKSRNEEEAASSFSYQEPIASNYFSSLVYRHRTGRPLKIFGWRSRERPFGRAEGKRSGGYRC